jgi:large subunit ribosomal protein L7/L12
MSDITREQAVEFLQNLSVMQLVGLTKELEGKWGVKALPLPPVITPEQKQPVEVVVEKTEFDVILTGYGDKKVQVIKTLRELTGRGLKESMELVSNLPRAIKEVVGKEEAEDTKSKLEAAGATVELK